MAENEQIAAEQAARWNGPSAQTWIENQDLLDRLYRPFEDLLVRFVGDVSSHRVLDIGCGTGSTTLAAARAISGRAVGVDISEPMIAVARERAHSERVGAEFVCGDVQSRNFSEAQFDTVISRFGVMFFSDPVAAFRNIHEAAEGGSHLRMIVWRNPDSNDIMVIAERAAASLLPDVPPRQPGTPETPGQFAFADPALVTPILEASGWRDITVEPLDVELSLPRPDMLRYVTTFGPVGGQLGTVDKATHGQVIDRLADAFTLFEVGPDVRYRAACWVVSAQA
ncbi:class I SAM-dependent methyltransferase [Nocardia sp. 348MFTsu5.1]|uniref:class I SAM-dependent methyltransferase n=1 Tax=Nocardia sp. 348MFTsu5.1 TaxID=1172185 RepID=UPI00036634ED|nr:class I SAM-dependent methyltransferase [Nocardia sp. 348MFTsu5.1]